MLCHRPAHRHLHPGRLTTGESHEHKIHRRSLDRRWESFDSLEAAREYAGELLGENDSLDIQITDENGQHHLTYAQLEFVKEVSEEPAPLGLSINLQIQISPDASEEQIETIIRQIRQLAAAGRV